MDHDVGHAGSWQSEIVDYDRRRGGRKPFARQSRERDVRVVHLLFRELKAKATVSYERMFVLGS